MTMAQPAADRPRPYASAFEQYQRAHWAVIPVVGKYPPEPGWTGTQGEWPSYADMLTWSEDHRGEHNIAIRLPHNVIGIDVDNYRDKRGGATLAECEAQWGPLPDTWRSTSRDDGVSGIRLFIIPDDLAWPGQLPGGGVEIIAWSHRYCMVWPSLHPEGRVYRWLIEQGATVINQVPELNQLAHLPQGWIDGLARGTYVEERKADLGLGGGAEWLTGLSGAGQPPCPRLSYLSAKLVDSLGSSSSRHETIKIGVLDLIRRAEEGHPGILAMLQAVGESFVFAVTADSTRSQRTAWGEWARLVDGAVRILAAQPRTPSLGDPCSVPSDPPWFPGEPLPRRRERPRVITTPWQDAGHQDRDSGPVLPAPVGVDPLVFNDRVKWLRADTAARSFLRAESAPPLSEQPTDYDLEEFVNVPDDPAIYRVGGLLPVGGRVVLAAQMKTGKTTFIGNLIRSLVDGNPFLGTFPISPPTGKVVLLDNEMDARTLRRWLRDMDIVNGSAARVIPMIGRVGGFDIRIPEVFMYWVGRLRAMNCEVLIIDCLKPILDVLALDERNETGKITTPLTNLKFAAGISELILVHHMGHNGERSRGDSALRGWPEVEWQLVRLAETPDQEAPMDAPRFFKAYGRDVDVPETQLVYSSGTRSLAMGTGTRREVQADSNEDRVLRIVTDEPGLLTNVVDLRLAKGNGKASNPLKALERRGLVRSERAQGSSRGVSWYPSNPFNPSGGMRVNPSPPLHRGMEPRDDQLELENPEDEG